MCGIAGLLHWPDAFSGPEGLTRLGRFLWHRGPDDGAFAAWCAERNQVICSDSPADIPSTAALRLVHRRLSILDRSARSRQPLISKDQRYMMVYNGEIYNYQELAEDLKQAGCDVPSVARSNDSHMLFTALQFWGLERVLEKAEGMFAFAFVDINRGKLFLVRDTFGIKPLYWTIKNGSLAFASEIAPLLELPNVTRKVHWQSLYYFLRFGYTDISTRSMFEDIQQVPSGCYMEVDTTSDRALIRPKFKPFRPICPDIDPDINSKAARHRLRAAFEESVALHMRSDRPVAVALSGGIDSTAIAMATTAMHPEREYAAFSFISPGFDRSEERWIRGVGKSTRNLHMNFVAPAQEDLLQDMKRLVKVQGEPFGSASIYAQYRVYQAASEAGYPVILDGQGADEMFGGYMPFVAARMADLVRQGNIGAALYLAIQSRSMTGNMHAVPLRASRYLLPLSLQFAGRRLLGEDLIPSWLNGDYLSRQGVTIKAWQHPLKENIFRHELEDSMFNRVLPALLRYQDRNSMAHSVESRVPFLTRKMWTFARTLPDNLLVDQNGTTKMILRKALEGLVSADILARKDKIGFEVPQSNWLKGHDRADTIDKLKDCPFVVGDKLGAAIDLNPAIEWRLMSLSLWADIEAVEFA